MNTPHAPITVEPVPEYKLPFLWPLCTELAGRMAYPSFFCTGDWLKAAAASLLPGDTLLVIAVYTESEL